ncbi:hypothetical protein CY34DRAFT_19519 [Suillus luteus UH-Slu-Lm8-n1]|uniref:Uncharacterized protein n=1 Tax=Suillus luteus UH-Slu-Lm8-n1 TaxID=930992 RepID=A0A0C9ZR83_9AGAM|nr:hypothetical protein CY34DRAFT_19519 [Suillus luteus UH-Slu-Lm8-n1]
MSLQSIAAHHLSNPTILHNSRTFKRGTTYVPDSDGHDMRAHTTALGSAHMLSHSSDTWILKTESSAVL